MKKKGRGRLSWVLVVFMLLLSLNGMNVSFASTADYYFSSIDVTFNDADIETLPSKLNDGDKVKMLFNWEIKNEALAADQVLKTDLPTIFDWSKVSGGVIEGNSPSTGNKKKYGDYFIVDEDSNGIYELKIVFGPLTDLESNVKGLVGFELALMTKTSTVELPYTWTVPINESDSKDIVFNIVPQGGKSLAKSGIRQGDNDIKWTIDFNTSLDTYTAPVLTDTYSSTLKYTSNSMTIHELVVNAKGDLSLGNDVTATALLEEASFINATTSSKTGLGGQGIIKFKDTSKAYRIEYVTSIDPEKIDISQTDFTYSNTVKLNSEAFLPQVDVHVSRGTLIEKSGLAPDDYNATYIDWTIRVNNAKYPLKNALVEDQLPAGLDLDDTSIVVEDAANPGIALTKDIDYTLPTVPLENGLLEIGLGDITKEYIIKYRTNVLNSARISDSADRLSFTNAATLHHDLGNATPKTGQPTVAVKLGRVIYKYGKSDISYNDKKYIDWELYINMGQASLGANRAVIDSFDDYQVLDTQQGIKVEALTLHANQDFDTSLSNPSDIESALGRLVNTSVEVTTPGAYAIDYESNDTPVVVSSNPQVDGVDKFTLTFANEVKSAYKISYRTILTDYDQSGYTNTGGIGGYSANFTARPTIANVYAKTRVGNGIDYLANTLAWRLTIHPEKEAVDGLVISDTIPNDQYVKASDFASFSLKKKGVDLNVSQVDTPSEDYYIDKVEEVVNINGVDETVVRSFTIHFLDTVNEGVYTFDYMTKINPHVFANHMTYTNTASFDWTGRGSSPLVKSASPNINNVASNNGKKTGRPNFAGKTIDWDVHINYLSKTMTDQQLSDTLPEGLLLKPNSVKVYEYSIDGNGNILDTMTEVTSNITIEEATDLRSFIVRFNGQHQQPYRIAYVSELDGISRQSYANTAILSTGEQYSATVDYTDYDQFVSKTGVPNGTSSVDWTVTVNRSRSTISNLRLTDTLSQGLAIDLNSFAILEAGMDFDDYFDVKVNPKALSTDPTVVVITIKDNQVINDMFRITYRTNIIEDEVIGKKVNNAIALSGDEINFGTKSAAYTESYETYSGFGVGSGEVGSFTMTKVDKDDPSIKLAGAEYLLKRGDKVIGSLTTDENGEITVNNLLYLEHSLTETKAPEGYKLDPTPHVFTINSPAKTFTLKNEKIRTLKIKKVDKANASRLLSGAKFEIYDELDQLVHTLVTDHTGYASISIDLGNYKVKEVLAPSNYYLDADEQNVSIDTSSDTFELVFKNTRKPSPQPVYTPEEEEEPKEEKPKEEKKEEAKPEPKPEPKPPVEVETKENEPQSGDVEVPDGGKVILDKEPENGTVTIDDDGKWTYTPNKDYDGDDTFTIKIEKPDGEEEIILFDIEIDDVPLGVIPLPQTGGEGPWLFFALGSIITLAGSGLLLSGRKH